MRDYFSRWDMPNVPEDLKSELGYGTWANALCEEVVPLLWSPAGARMTMVEEVKNFLTKGHVGELEVDQLEDRALYEGLKTYQEVIDSVGMVYKMSEPYPENYFSGRSH